MEATVENLEAKFKSVESSIDLISAHLDCEYGIGAEKKEGAAKKNPVKLIEELQLIKDEYAKLTDEIKEIQNDQKEAIQEFKQEMSMLSECMAAAQGKIGLEKTAIDEAQSSHSQPATSEMSENLHKENKNFSHLCIPSTPKPATFKYDDDEEEGDTITLSKPTLPCLTPVHR